MFTVGVIQQSFKQANRLVGVKNPTKIFFPVIF